jgi:leucyl aminopeptidase
VPLQTQLRTLDETIRSAAARAEAVAVPVRSGPEIDPAYADGLAGMFTLGAADLLAHEEARGEPGEIVRSPFRMGGGITEMLLFGVGDGSPAALRKAGAALAREFRGRGQVLAGGPSEASEDALAAFAEGLLLASYDFTVAGPAKRPGAETISVVTLAPAALDRGATVARAVALARDLTNTPSREKCPQWLAGRAEELAADAGLTVRVRDEAALAAEGFGGILAVGSGSSRPPRLIEVAYEPDAAVPGGSEAGEHLVLVGKGITFDSGGLSLKPNAGMKTMKTDMAGGAVVLAVMSTLRAIKVPVRVTGLVPAAENMPSGSAMRPGDVIRHYGGTTSEVLNTDAEGRLVLADALAYADAELAPSAVVDIATLTGAAKVALGLRHSALYSTDETLATGLIDAAETSGEAVWRMPLVEEYRESIDSDVADVANAGRGGFGGGSILAALFLREFAGDRPWAHLDVAGPARAASDSGELTKGATGYGVRLLLSYLAAVPASR